MSSLNKVFKGLLAGLISLAVVQASASWSPPTAEIQAVYAPKQPDPYFKNWDEKTKSKYGALRSEQMKLVDMEEELYNTAWSPDNFYSSKLMSELTAIELEKGLTIKGINCIDADQKLNNAFQKAIKSSGNSQVPCKECEALLRKVERQWLKYRDAWIDFGTSRFPTSQRATWQCWQADKRRTHITEFDINMP